MEKSKVELIIQSIGNFVRSSMAMFGLDVNTKRQLPYLYDGLKPSYRHIIYEELKSGPHMRKSVDVVGSCLSTTHGHGDASLKGPVSNLVRWGISEGQGNHGRKMLRGEDIEPSAMRYTETRISDKYLRIFSELMPYVPYIDSEVKGTEPKYLPTIFPICLAFGTSGIGIGVNCRIPAFTVPSMMDALINDDPSLLEAPFGLHIIHEESELQQLWDTGVGKVCYSFDVYKGTCDGAYGSYIEGSPELFAPLLTELERLERASRIYIIDQSVGDATRIFVGREYNVKSVNFDEIHEMCERAAKNVRTYRLTVADDESAYLIPLKEWLNITYVRYHKLIEDYKQDKTRKAEFNYQVFQHLPAVAEEITSNRDTTSDAIANKLGIALDVVKTIISKPISMIMRTKDTSAQLAKLQSEIEYYKNLDPNQKIKDIIDEF